MLQMGGAKFAGGENSKKLNGRLAVPHDPGNLRFHLQELSLRISVFNG
jgi:hypothetical protein